MSSDQTGETPAASAQPDAHAVAVAMPFDHTGEPTPSTGRRQALRDLRRELSNEDLASPGVQKMLLDELGRADDDCDVLRGYVTRFHDADKRAAVLEEKLRTQTALEVACGVGIGLGGAIMGLAPSFWNSQPLGYLTLLVGFLFIVGAAIARVIKQ
jgi:hypothetical protein